MITIKFFEDDVEVKGAEFSKPELVVAWFEANAPEGLDMEDFYVQTSYTYTSSHGGGVIL